LIPYFLLLGYMASVVHIVFIILRYQDDSKYAGVWYFPGLFGIFLALVILQSKTTLPDGRRIVTYNSNVIRHGMIMLGLNILAFVVNILIWVFFFA